MKKIKVLGIMGKAGAGKDKIYSEILKLDPSLHGIVSCTSRPIREGEQNGINYYFYTFEEFQQKVANNEMLESTMFNGWCYGTSLDGIREDKINIGVFNPEGIETLSKDSRIDLYVVEIWAKDKTRMLRQLNRETWPDVDEIVRRYGTDKTDFVNFYNNFNKPFTLFHNEIEGGAAAVAANVLSSYKEYLDEKQ